MFTCPSKPKREWGCNSALGELGPWSTQQNFKLDPFRYSLFSICHWSTRCHVNSDPGQSLIYSTHWSIFGLWLTRPWLVRYLVISSPQLILPLVNLTHMSCHPPPLHAHIPLVTGCYRLETVITKQTFPLNRDKHEMLRRTVTEPEVDNVI